MKNVKTILAMDLSLNLPAFAVLEIVDNSIKILDIRYCDNKPLTRKTHAEKLQRIADVIRNLITKYPNIDLVVRERGFSRYAATTQSLFKVVGISDLLILERLGFPTVHEIPPTSVKKHIVGDGKASKQQVDKQLRKYLVEEQKEVKFTTDDGSDSVAVGIAYLLQEGILKND